MKYAQAVAIIKKLNPNDIEDISIKGQAIYEMLKMPTINSITKDDLRNCVEWLWNLSFEIEKPNE